MTNIEEKKEKLRKNAKKLFGFCFIIFFIFFIFPNLFIWIAYDFDPDAVAIDRCLDRGGGWDEQNKTCMGIDE